jgi:hypothetical protein
MVKIWQAFGVNVVDLRNYKIMFFINCLYPKPSTLLQLEDEYNLLLHHYGKASPGKEPVVNISIMENAEKENVPADHAKKNGNKKVIYPC